MEVGDIFNPLVKEMYKIFPRVQPDFQPFSSLLDLDSAVSSGGLDHILTPPAGQTPNHPARSFFQSVTVTKLVKPDGVRETVCLNLIMSYILINYNTAGDYMFRKTSLTHLHCKALYCKVIYNSLTHH